MEVPPDAFELRAGKQSSLEALRARAVHASAEPVQPIPSSVTAAPPARPAYPSSKAAQKKTVTDWDKLERELEKEEEDELSGDAALNAMFQKIYKNANEETRRAMNKSFQESAGTVLSTDWDDIGKKKTEVQPPEGMEAKKYEI